LRDHLIISMALGTGLRLGEIVGLNVGDVYAPNGRPRVHVRIKREIAKRVAIRHSAVTNVYRKTRDLFLAQRFARHVSPPSTTVYTHPSDDEMRERLRGLGC